MNVFDLYVPDHVLDAIATHGERDYPNEACGLVLGRAEVEATRAVEMKNVQDRYFALDPVAFPRTGRDAFRMDELERMRTLDEASEKGLEECIVYHSHCDAGAYFSPEDRAMAVQDGLELMPGVVHVVVSIRDGHRADIAAYRYDKDRATFDEQRLGAMAGGLPDLELRAMEGKEAARPLRPVGGALGMRVIDEHETAALLPLAKGRRIEVDARTVEDLGCFAAGYYSPLTGFMRRAQVRSVLDRGRLPEGTPWRVPIVLEVRESAAPEGLTSGAIVELVDGDGQSIALMAVDEVAPAASGRIIVGGPVYVHRRPANDSAESRASVLRQSAKRVLAIPADRAGAAQHLDLSSFDVVMTETPISGVDCVGLTTTSRSPWLMAAMAQNQGATHLWIEDSASRRVIEESLEIAAWP